MKVTRRAAIAATALTSALVLAACGGSSDGGETTTPTGDATTSAAPSPTETGGGDLTGSIVIDGSSTVGPLTEPAAELFMQANPGVQVTVAVSGTSGGFEKFCNGETDGNNASRAIKEAEIELCAENGIAYDNITVANDALTVLVNGDAPVACMTVEQLNAIWDDGSSITTWGQIPDLDVPADFADTPLSLYGPGTDSGTFDFFTEEINGEEGRIRIDYTSIGEDDNAAVTAITGDVGAMGYVPFAFYQEAGDAVKGIAIDGGDGCIDPTAENVQNGIYTPLGRPLFVYASDKALQQAATVAFFEFYINNSDQIAEIAGAVGLTDEQKAEQIAKVQALAGS